MTDRFPKSRVALGAALKQALTTTPLSRVTVSSLTAAAGTSRQTFYTHFSNVYDLAAWVFSVEAVDHMLTHAAQDEWADGLVKMLRYMEAHKEETYAITSSLDHTRLERFFFRAFREVVQIIAENLETEYQLSPEDREFVIDHYALVGVGHLLHWLCSDMDTDPYVLAANMEFILNGALRQSFERFASKR